MIIEREDYNLDGNWSQKCFFLLLCSIDALRIGMRMGYSIQLKEEEALYNSNSTLYTTIIIVIFSYRPEIKHEPHYNLPPSRIFHTAYPA
jgi:hypothetical protein